MGRDGSKELAPRLKDVADRLRGRRWRIVPHPGPVEREQGAAGGKSGALRAAIFGMNDGLVSNLSLIFGVTGAGVNTVTLAVPALARSSAVMVA